MNDAAHEYLAYSRDAADLVVRRYSSSFSLASRVLDPHVRTGIRDVYAFVRVADEIVDGAVEDGAVARLDRPDPSVLIDRLEGDVVEALTTGFSANPVLHAFAATARDVGIGLDLIDPFLDSMRLDVTVDRHTAESVATYIHGSAEVVGLMCLRVFLADLPEGERIETYERLAPGAMSLGAAFQKVNFLRDLAQDRDELGRDYLTGLLPPGAEPLHDGRLTESAKAHIAADIRADLAAGEQALAGLPEGSRHGVAAALDIFRALVDVIDATPAEEISRRRVRVRRRDKARITAPHVIAAARHRARHHVRGMAQTMAEHSAQSPRQSTSTEAGA